MSLPSTLDEMQLQILQEDLADNPYLQPHAIASKDKELKTTAKKIIPAINELLKNLTVVNTTMQGFTDEVSQSVNALRIELTAYIDKGIEETVIKNTEDIEALKQLMEEYMDTSLSEKVEQLETSFTEKLSTMQLTYDQKFNELAELIANLNNNGNAGDAGTGGEDLKLEFAYEVELASDSGNYTTEYDANTFDVRQLKVMMYSSTFSQYFMIEPDMTTIKTSSTSVYQCWTYPLVVTVNADNKVVLRNKGSNKLKVLVHNIV